MTDEEFKKAIADNYLGAFDKFLLKKKQDLDKLHSISTSPAMEVVRYFGADWASDCGLKQHPREEATAIERARIRAALQHMKPSETPFSRGSYELERKAEMRLWEKMMRAVGE